MLSPLAANQILTQHNIVPRAEWVECYPRPDTVEVCLIGRGNQVWQAKLWNVGDRVFVKLKPEPVPRPD